MAGCVVLVEHGMRLGCKRVEAWSNPYDNARRSQGFSTPAGHPPYTPQKHTPVLGLQMLNTFRAPGFCRAQGAAPANRWTATNGALKQPSTLPFGAR